MFYSRRRIMSEEKEAMICLERANAPNLLPQDIVWTDCCRCSTEVMLAEASMAMVLEHDLDIVCRDCGLAKIAAMGDEADFDVLPEQLDDPQNGRLFSLLQDPGLRKRIIKDLLEKSPLTNNNKQPIGVNNQK
jgi:hypothetical protein